MEIEIIKIEKQWKVLKRDEAVYNQQELESTLYSLNQVDGGSYYMIDYFRQRIVTDSESSWILCGHSKEEADKHGLKFFERILSKEEWLWLAQVNQESYVMFFNCPKEERKNLVLSLDLTVTSIHGEERILHHKITPFKLCSNGNMWLGLCKVFPSLHRKMNDSASIINTSTGQRHDFVNNTFALQNNYVLTLREVKILRWSVQGLSEPDMCKELNFSMSHLKRIKQELYKKLAVKKISEAIHKARLERII